MTGETRRSPGFYGARMDAEVPENGQPVEIKAVASNQKGGRTNETRFKIWRDQHAALKKASGYYVFVVYRLRSDSIRVTHSQSIRASSLSIDWYGKTIPSGQEQAELQVSQLFGQEKVYEHHGIIHILYFPAAILGDSRN